jgi:predicted nucleic acid-binding protein
LSLPARLWLDRALEACATGGGVVLLPLVATGFVRLATNRKVVINPVPTSAASAYIDALLAFPGVVMPEVGRQWPAMKRLCLAGKLQAPAGPRPAYGARCR